MNLAFLKQYKIFAHEELKHLTLLENQGYNNTNYLLKTSKYNYLIRVFKSKSLNRELEFKVANKAFKKGIGQKPLLLDKKNALMISRFTQGTHKYKLTKHEIQKLAKTIHKLHQITCHQKPYDLLKDYKNYSKKPLGNRVFQTNLLFKKLKKFKKEHVLCHHDLNPRNIIFQKNSIKIIDWEYAGVNDRYFDLATVVEEFAFDKKEVTTFLQTYFTCKEKINYEKLWTYTKIYKALCKLWFFAHMS